MVFFYWKEFTSASEREGECDNSGKSLRDFEVFMSSIATHFPSVAYGAGLRPRMQAARERKNEVYQGVLDMPNNEWIIAFCQ